jgi:uncharacterized protein (DUF58 family)
MSERSHARPGSRFIDPLVLARIDNLGLLARTVVEGFIGGLHRSPYRGLSVDFAEHRQYMPGDDIRLIDWRVYGRTDRFYIKQFEVDSNTNFTVMLDSSRSMAYRHADAALSKLDYGKYLAACLTYFAHKQRDRVGFVSFDDDVRDYVPPAAKHRDLILHTIDRLQPRGASDLDRPMLKVAESSRRRGIMVLISDLYEEPKAARDAIQRLAFKGNDLIVFHVLDPAEIEFPFEDAANYRDMETGESIPVTPDRLGDQYRSMVQEHLASLESTLGAARIDYSLFETSRPLDHALFAYLALRQRLTTVR